MAIFGYNAVGGSNWNYNVDEIFGSKFTLTENGDLTKITAYTYSSAGDKARCVVYDSPLNYKGQTNTNNWAFGKAWGWEDYTFAAALSLTAGDYWLVWFSDADANWNYLKYDAGAAGQGGYKAQAWNGAPDPIAWDGTNTNKASIYATYTPTSAGPKKGSSLASTMAQMLNSKMLFSACNPYSLRV